MADAVERAMAVVDRAQFVTEGGAALAQSSSPAIISSVLRLLDVEPGTRVFEVGTGSGFSTALLCHMVGPTGYVFSVDIDPALTLRAAVLLQRAGYTQAEVATGDGRLLGHGAVPFDRLVAWGTADFLPEGWVASLPKGHMVAPVRLASLQGAALVARIAVHKGIPVVQGFLPGGFVPLTTSPVQDWEALRRQGYDLVVDCGADPLLLSAPWLRETPGMRGRLRACASDLVPCPAPLASDEFPEDLWWYLVATAPEGLTSAQLVPRGWLFGCSDPDGLVLVLRRLDAGGVQCLAGGQPLRCWERLSTWIAGWRLAGKPGIAHLKGAMQRMVGMGWQVRAVM